MRQAHSPVMASDQTRRTFLKTAATGLAGVATATIHPEFSSAAAVRADGKSGSLIIDTHTHFYDPSRPQGVPWPNRNDSLLYRTVLPKDYQALPKPQPVAGTVVVEASPWVEDNQWILDLAVNDPFIVGLVGNLPVGKQEFAGHLPRFAANKLFRGIRVGAASLKDGLAQPHFVADLKLLASLDLQLDVNGPPSAVPEVARLAALIPELRIVIDHVANVKIDGRAADAAWLEAMCAAAGHRNVNCKVSGLVEGSGRSDGTAPREVAFYRPVLDVIWEAFGEDRLIYGSNWPVSERFAPCATVQGIVRDYFQARGVAAVEKVFWKNAQAVYKWVKR